MAGRTFKDIDGREWPLRRITFGDYDDLAAVGLDVESVSEDIVRLGDLVGDRLKFAAVLWWFVGPAVEAAKLTPKEFHRLLDGDALHAAAVALRDTVIDFFPYPAAAKAELIARFNSNRPTAPAGSDAEATSTPPSPDSTPAA